MCLIFNSIDIRYTKNEKSLFAASDCKLYKVMKVVGPVSACLDRFTLPCSWHKQSPYLTGHAEKVRCAINVTIIKMLLSHI